MRELRSLLSLLLRLCGRSSLCLPVCHFFICCRAPAIKLSPQLQSLALSQNFIDNKGSNGTAFCQFLVDVFVNVCVCVCMYVCVYVCVPLLILDNLFRFESLSDVYPSVCLCCQASAPVERSAVSAV